MMFKILNFIWIYFLPTLAFAHIVKGETGGFGTGFLHPSTGPDHFLAMFAVGLWGAQLGGRSVWTLPLIFPLIMLVGGIVGFSGITINGIEIGIAASLLMLGLVISLKWQPKEWKALILIAFFGFCHGYAHGAELPSATDPFYYALGFVSATITIHLLGIVVGLSLNNLANGLLVRLLGSLIFISGIFFMILAI